MFASQGAGPRAVVMTENIMTQAMLVSELYRGGGIVQETWMGLNAIIEDVSTRVGRARTNLT